ncbi:predicted protein [Streptomyces viridosporus ATCC 14672]|uniref:Predicted protein n=1 Tax=Streptomyces viridosporus (strain ATCC 14672 / DSM 40746 / JCM 4963 / KCTC 9882 / NRRL B-12104 / FH 1290) TaxID=566461 RepID=D6A6J9_STRV1|nr:predicted protein [Streptomyces viridosporus ATCC 14672]
MIGPDVTAVTPGAVFLAGPPDGTAPAGPAPGGGHRVTARRADRCGRREAEVQVNDRWRRWRDAGFVLYRG